MEVFFFVNWRPARYLNLQLLLPSLPDSNRSDADDGIRLVAMTEMQPRLCGGFC